MNILYMRARKRQGMHKVGKKGERERARGNRTRGLGEGALVLLSFFTYISVVLRLPISCKLALN